jgi:hypothetical protein
MFTRNLLIWVTVLMGVAAIGTPDAAAQTAAPDAPVADRIKQLEAQVELLRVELEKVKQASMVAKTETVAIVPASVKTEPAKPADAAVPKDKVPEQSQKQIGFDVANARVIPYGTIYFNSFSNTGGTNNADVPLFATATGAKGTSASVRQTRLGVRLEGAKVKNARLGAVVEADFFGGFPGVAIGENFGVVRLRLANVRLDWEKTSFVAGQDWMVFAPLNPVSLAAAAIPQMAAGGNNWARLPQLKVERRFGYATVQAAVLAPQTGDYVTTSTFFLQPTSGAASRTPFFQGRAAFSGKNWLGTKKIGTVGLSGHFGQSRVFTGVAGDIANGIDSAGVALDWNIPLHDRLTVTGEGFFGRNLGGFQAGIFQGYNNDFAYRGGTTLVAGGVRAIGTRGGWAQIGFTPDAFGNNLTIYSSIGLDDPHDEDLVSRTPRDFRKRNLATAANLIYKFTPQLQIGAEFRRFWTQNSLTGRRTANHTNLALAYTF